MNPHGCAILQFMQSILVVDQKNSPEALAPRDLSHFLAIKHNHFLRGIC